MTINFIVLLCYLHCFNNFYVIVDRYLLYHSSAHYIEIPGSHDSRTMHTCTCSYGNNHFMSLSVHYETVISMAYQNAFVALKTNVQNMEGMFLTILPANFDTCTLYVNLIVLVVMDGQI